MPTHNETKEIQNQIRLIRDAIKHMMKDAKYGSYHDFLHDLIKIDASTRNLQSRLIGAYSVTRKYGKILVPYDGSRYSKKALIEALEIAKAFQSKVYVLTIIEIASDIPPSLLHKTINQKLAKIRRLMTTPQKYFNLTKLQRQIDECKKQDILIDVDVMVGKAADSILKFAKNNKIELIIMGSKGLRGMKKLTSLGSVSRRVSEEVKCPVMIIR